MSYIGRGTESISNVEVLDNLTFDGSASYTLQKSSVNFVPSSANNLLISISGVVQQGNFSVSGSTITFDTTVSASDTCDWILHYGTGLITTVADGAITEAKLGSNAVTTAKINNGAITSAKLDSGLALGKIGQVVNATTTTQVQSTSGTFVDSTIVASITPSSTSSKIIINIQMFCQLFGNSVNTDVEGKYKIVRTIGGSATSLFTSSNNPRFSTFDSNTDFFMFNFPIVHVDSPSTTSTCEYKIQIASGAGVGNSRFSAQQDNQESNIVLMEVLA